MRAVLSIGSNMDDRYALLDTVFDHFADSTIARSSVYSTPPWGVEDQDEFLNAVLIIDTDLDPYELLREGQALENAAERRRIRRWGPRTLDVDIVQVLEPESEGGESASARTGWREVLSDDPTLTLPHPWAHERAFVLVPWLEADPNAVLGGKPVSELLEGLDTSGIVRAGQ